MSDWVTIQFFVSDDGTFEVEASNKNYRRMKCNCTDFNKFLGCKHVKYVRQYIDENDGMFSVKMPDDMSDSELEDVINGDTNFRDILLKYGKVVYLP